MPARPIRRRTALLSGVALAVGLPIVTAVPAAALAVARPTAQPRFTLPGATGHHRVGTTTLHLVDPSRPDPWVPGDTVRELMIQLWYPTTAEHGFPFAPLMTPGTARAYEKANGLPVLDWPLTDGMVGAPVQHNQGGWPVVVYSHSLGGERTETTAVVADLASHGHVVVTIDHVHDAGVVELPDGTIATVAIPPFTPDNEVEQTTKAILSRVADVRFVLDQLAAINRGELVDGLRGPLDLHRVGMFGQSDGGATTGHAIHVDDRIRVGVNLDGTLWTPAAQAGSDRPFLLFGKQNPDPTEVRSWDAFMSDQRGPKLRLNLLGSQHSTFTDLAVLLPQAASLLHFTPEQVAAVVGTIDGHRAVTIQRTYLRAYFGTYLRHHPNHLLAGPSPRFPEVLFAG